MVQEHHPSIENLTAELQGLEREEVALQERAEKIAKEAAEAERLSHAALDNYLVKELGS